MKNWQPGDDLVIIISDQTAEARSKEELELMHRSIERAAHLADFSVRAIGSIESLQEFFDRMRDERKAS